MKTLLFCKGFQKRKEHRQASSWRGRLGISGGSWKSRCRPKSSPPAESSQVKWIRKPGIWIICSANTGEGHGGHQCVVGRFSATRTALRRFGIHHHPQHRRLHPLTGARNHSHRISEPVCTVLMRFTDSLADILPCPQSNAPSSTKDVWSSHPRVSKSPMRKF
jgi:hypothetical protein